MRAEDLDRLEHILEAAERIATYAAPGEEAFLADPMRQDAIIRNLSPTDPRTDLAGGGRGTADAGRAGAGDHVGDRWRSDIAAESGASEEVGTPTWRWKVCSSARARSKPIPGTVTSSSMVA